MKNARQQRGDWGEGVAAAYLENKGIRVIEKNVRSVFGEIDLVCTQGKELVFVEVKTRTSGIFGHPEEAITPFKQKKLRQLAEWYWRTHEQYTSIRVDVVAIRVFPEGLPEIRHISGVF